MTLGEFVSVYYGDESDIVEKYVDNSGGWITLYNGDLNDMPMIYSQKEIGSIGKRGTRLVIYLKKD